MFFVSPPRCRAALSQAVGMFSWSQLSLPHPGQNVLENQQGIRVVVPVFRPQLGEHFQQLGRIVLDAHLLVVGGQDRVFFAPHLVPVDVGLGLLADGFNHLLGLLLVKVVLDELIQRHVVEQGQPFGLADVGQRFAGLTY